MAGTFVKDANAANLLAGSTLNAAGTTNGTIVQVNDPCYVSFELATATVTGTTPTLVVEIEGDQTADFTGTTTRSLFTFDGLGDNDDATFRSQSIFIDAKFIRTRVTLGGTSPVYTGSTCTMQAPFYKHEGSLAAAAAQATAGPLT